MKESMMVAKTVAWSILGKTNNTKQISKKWKKYGATGLHIHCPDGSTRKDGPSAGGAITTCILSALTGIPIKHSIAMTGEINLEGTITEIGGLEEKVSGAIRSGVRLVLYPRENENDAKEIRESFPSWFEGDFDMRPVDTIHDILKIVLVKPITYDM